MVDTFHWTEAAMVRCARGWMLISAICAALSSRAWADDHVDLNAAIDKAIAANAKADYPEALRQYERAARFRPTFTAMMRH